MKLVASVSLPEDGYSVAYSPTGRCFAVGCSDGSALLVDSGSFTVLHALKSDRGRVQSCAFSPDGTLLATTSWDEIAKLWRVATGLKLRTLFGHTSCVMDVVFTGDGKHIISASFDETARVWDVATGTLLHTLSLPRQGYSVALSAAGTLLAVGCLGYEPTVALFDVAKGYTPLSTFNVPGHDDHRLRLCFSPVCGSSLLMTCGRWNSEVKLWDLSNTVASVAASGGGAAPPKLVGVLRGHTCGICDARFSGDGALIATASYDKTVKVWDALTGRELRTLAEYDDTVLRVAFQSTDSGVLVSCSSDRTACVWTS